MKYSVVITGSTKGIGRCLAESFAHKDYNVCITGRNEQEVNEVVVAIQQAFPKVLIVGIPCDVSLIAENEKLFAFASEKFNNKIDIWINNAGLARTNNKGLDITPEDVEAMIKTNLMGGIYGVQVAYKGLKKQPSGGTIWQILGGGSDGSIRDGMSVYSSTKIGLKMFVDSVAKEEEGNKKLVRLNHFMPGMLVTEGMIREAKEMGRERFEKYRFVMRVLCDDPKVACPWLVDEMIRKHNDHGAQVKWLTTPTIIGRFLTGGFGRPDLFQSVTF